MDSIESSLLKMPFMHLGRKHEFHCKGVAGRQILLEENITHIGQLAMHDRQMMNECENIVYEL